MWRTTNACSLRSFPFPGVAGLSRIPRIKESRVRGRAGDRVGDHHAVAPRHEPLRARADERRARGRADEEAVALGIAFHQAAEDARRVDVARGFQLDRAREHRLLEGTRPDLVQHRAHSVGPFSLAPYGQRGARERRCGARGGIVSVHSAPRARVGSRVTTRGPDLRRDEEDGVPKSRREPADPSAKENPPTAISGGVSLPSSATAARARPFSQLLAAWNRPGPEPSNRATAPNPATTSPSGVNQAKAGPPSRRRSRMASKSSVEPCFCRPASVGGSSADSVRDSAGTSGPERGARRSSERESGESPRRGHARASIGSAVAGRNLSAGRVVPARRNETLWLRPRRPYPAAMNIALAGSAPLLLGFALGMRHAFDPITWSR